MAPFWVIYLTLILLTLSGGLAFARLLRGPSLPDRLIAFDVLALIGVGFMAVLAILSDRNYFLDILLIWSIVAFVGTVAFARYLEKKTQRIQ